MVKPHKTPKPAWDSHGRYPRDHSHGCHGIAGSEVCLHRHIPSSKGSCQQGRKFQEGHTWKVRSLQPGDTSGRCTEGLTPFEFQRVRNCILNDHFYLLHLAALVWLCNGPYVYALFMHIWNIMEPYNHPMIRCCGPRGERRTCKSTKPDCGHCKLAELRHYPRKTAHIIVYIYYIYLYIIYNIL